MDKFNLDLKVKGENGAKQIKEYLKDIETKINDIVGWNIPKEFLDSSKMTTIEDETDANDYKTPGLYYCSVNTINGTIANFPKAACSKFMLVIKLSGSVYMQIVFLSEGNEIYMRRYLNGTWRSWYKFESAITSEETLTFDSKITASIAKVIKKNDLVFLQIVAQNTGDPIAAETTLTTISTGFRPKADTRLIAAISGEVIVAEIKSTGKVSLKGEFVKSKWLSFTITYFV